MADLTFAPLSIPVSSKSEGLDTRYKIITTSGEVITVEAGSAAEAMAKAEGKNPLRIISLAQEQRRLMEKNLLHPQERSVDTNIDMDKYVADFRALVVEDLGEEEKPPFEEMSWGDIAKKHEDVPLPEPESEPEVTAEEPALPASEMEVQIEAPQESEPEPEPEPQAEPEEAGAGEQEVIPPDRELTPEEVEALMASGGEADPKSE